MSEKKGVTVNSALMELVDQAQPRLGAAHHGPGLRSTLTMNLVIDGESHEIVLFSEHVLPDFPEDDGIGYEEGVDRHHSGVALSHIEVNDESASKTGEVIAFKTFLDKVVTDSVLRLKLERRMEELRQGSKPSPEYLEQMNMMWANREVGVTDMGPNRTLH